MKQKTGIVGFSFGLRAEALEPNPSNLVLGSFVKIAYDCMTLLDRTPVVVTQWEITKALRQQYGMSVDHSVEPRTGGSYLDSRMVWEEAMEEFERQGVTDVVIVAQPFLHLPKLKAMVKGVKNDNGESIYSLRDIRPGPVPFDNSPLNTQPWTRTKPALVRYSVRSLIPGFKHGHNGMQDAI